MLQAGIVGLPNVGKSTLFNALTRTRKAEAANYPFCTIEPNVGVVEVPDPRLEPLAAMWKSAELVPTAIEFVDIAGLVRGASKGEGLGNKFLAHIREVDAVVEVVRCFEDGDIVHVDAALDPLSDIDTIHTELLLADIDSLERQRERLQKSTKGGDKSAFAQIAVADKLLAHLGAGRRALTCDLTPEERALARPFFLLSAKPTLFACNVAEEELAGADANPLVGKVRDWVAHHHGAEAVVVSARIEAELGELSSEEAKDYLASLGVDESGVSALIRATYHLLGLITFLTAGEKQARAWTLHAGESAAAAAGTIHSDFERGFIRAETIAFDDLVRHGSWHAARDAGALRQEGRDYVVRDGDVMLFKFNV
ncbi:MAG: redox-regulated ATPase YchF [Holophagales bacterium]|nr:redox-regulated ATPase YchF [Holophagales bacterium]